jgi:hypothetical protein
LAKPSHVLTEWTFDREGDFQGWQPNAQLADAKVIDGALMAQADGADPILELRSSIALRTSPWQEIEIRLKADLDGVAEFFWSNTTQGRYGGFSQEKSTRFNIAGDRQWRVYRLLPFWHPEGRIVRLRFDPNPGAHFAIDYLRILELRMPPTAPRAEFNFGHGQLGWQAVAGAGLGQGRAGLSLLEPDPEAFLLAPPLQLDAEENPVVSLLMTVNQGRYATLLFATEATPGLQSVPFAIQPDSREHRYHLDLLAAPGWRGRVIALGLRPTDAGIDRSSGKASAKRIPNAWVKAIALGAESQGPPQLEVASFNLEEALPRAGVPGSLQARLVNKGGVAVTNLQVRLRLPPELRLLDPAAQPLSRSVAALGFDEESVFTWPVVAREPFAGMAQLKFWADNHKTERTSANLTITARHPVPRFDGVPEPHPVQGPYEVGVYYFPGWRTASQWQPLQRYPERKPVLGWYREGDPEVADWHIKWAVEHGITFFAYDWYWSQGTRQLEHALHDGYFRARYRQLLKFCLLWANHNPPGTSSVEDCVAVTHHWLQHYFHRPEYLTIEGKPLVIIFSPDRLGADLGSAKVKAALEMMRDQCRQAGLPGLFLMACIADVGQARQAAAEGYDAVTAYTWPGLGLRPGQSFGPYENLLDGYRRNWIQILEHASIPLGLPVCGGWDSRPWHGDNNLVRYGRTPELFRRHLTEARQCLEIHAQQSPLRNFLLIEAWNEWGEGSYIEPHQEFGFGYLDAVRTVLTPAPRDHLDIIPADVGLGPYNVPVLELTSTAWNFADSASGWEQAMDVGNLRIHESALTGQTTGNDPAIFGPPMRAPAGEFTAVVLRMKLWRDDGRPFQDVAQLFWRTSRLPENEATSQRVQVHGDGQWHVYRIEVGQNPRWRGVITRLRFDPCNQAGIRMQLAALRLEPRPLTRE